MRSRIRRIMMMIATLVLSIALTAGPAGPTGPAELAFLAGEWEGGTPELRIEERWTGEAGGLMLGLGRTVKGERAVAFEFLRIEFRKDGVVYVAQPGGVPPTEFPLTSADGRSATFENPQHDHPKKLRYALSPEGELIVDLDGDEGKQTFRFRKAKGSP
jgi:hypothetical protein